MVDKYGTGGDTQYCYPGSEVLINKLGFTDEVAPEAAEVELTQASIEQFRPGFDDISLSALRGIHRFLFQDVYEWAGELRTVDISKGNTRFANVSRVEPEADKLFGQHPGHSSLRARLVLLDKLTPRLRTRARQAPQKPLA